MYYNYYNDIRNAKYKDTELKALPERSFIEIASDCVLNWEKHEQISVLNKEIILKFL